MRVFRGLSQPSPSATVLTIGNFDGVHLGHRALLARLCAVAGETGLPPAVLTFEPHPREFFAPESAPTRLSNLREKLELIAADGVELAFVARFNKAFASLTADQFIEDVLVKTLRVRHLIIGDDFRFGKARGGDFALLQQAGPQQDLPPGFTALPKRMMSRPWRFSRNSRYAASWASMASLVAIRRTEM